MKRSGEKIAMLTAYDAPTARALAAGGADILLVGDSVGTNMLGYASERDVTMADMVHHIAAVRRGAPDAYIVGDFCYGSYETPSQAVENGRRLVCAGADMVKFEGAAPAILRALREVGLEVCCHIGLEPQHHAEKRLQGKTAEAARQLIENAKILDEAGMTMLVLELIPEEVAAAISAAVRAPTIGIGAGRDTDGQVLVATDVLGFGDASFKHNKRYATVGETMRQAAQAYREDVKSRAFPAESNAFKLPAGEAALFRASAAV